MDGSLKSQGTSLHLYLVLECVLVLVLASSTCYNLLEYQSSKFEYDWSTNILRTCTPVLRVLLALDLLQYIVWSVDAIAYYSSSLYVLYMRPARYGLQYSWMRLFVCLHCARCHLKFHRWMLDRLLTSHLLHKFRMISYLCRNWVQTQSRSRGRLPVTRRTVRKPLQGRNINAAHRHHKIAWLGYLCHCVCVHVWSPCVWKLRSTMVGPNQACCHGSCFAFLGDFDPS